MSELIICVLLRRPTSQTFRFTPIRTLIVPRRHGVRIRTNHPFARLGARICRGHSAHRHARVRRRFLIHIVCIRFIKGQFLRVLREGKKEQNFPNFKFSMWWWCAFAIIIIIIIIIAYRRSIRIHSVPLFIRRLRRRSIFFIITQKKTKKTIIIMIFFTFANPPIRFNSRSDAHTRSHANEASSSVTVPLLCSFSPFLLLLLVLLFSLFLNMDLTTKSAPAPAAGAPTK